jgi:Flp pilus assembly protein TadG
VRREAGDEGQAAVELALVLPLVLAMLLALVQVGLLVRDQVLVIHAAREAAREVAVDGSPGAGERAARAATSALRRDRLSVDSSGRSGPGSRVRVTVLYRSPTEVPLVGEAVGDLTVKGEATMRVES